MGFARLGLGLALVLATGGAAPGAAAEPAPYGPAASSGPGPPEREEEEGARRLGLPGAGDAEAGLLDLAPPLRRGRRALAERGLRAELVYWGEWLANLRGGRGTEGAHAYKGLLGLFLTLETGRAGLWEGGRLQVHVEQSHGEGISERFVGDRQTLSNIDAEPFTQLSQLWLRQDLLGGRAFLKAGKQEANDLFAASLHAQPFLHSSAGLPPNVPIPSYPDQDWGLAAGAELLPERLALRGGLFQGEPDGGRPLSESFSRLLGPLAIAEVELSIAPAGGLPGALRIGAWRNALDAPRLDAEEPAPGEVDASHGLYAVHDQWLWREPGAAADGAAPQGVALFAQYAWAPADRSEVEHYAGAGLGWRGALPDRDADFAGLAVYHARLSPGLGTARRAETAFEALYAAELRRWLVLKLDGQLVLHPGGAELREALVLGARLRVHF